MKISCTKKEFAALIRACDKASARFNCYSDCVFSGMCSHGAVSEEESKIMAKIEDICEIIPECGRNG